MNIYDGRTLIVGFVLLAVVSTVAVVALAGGGLEELAYALAGGVGVAIVVVGSYKVGDAKGLPHSHSVAIAGITLGVVYMVALAVRLLTEFGA